MKCLQVAGDELLVGEFIRGMVSALQTISVLVASGKPDGEAELTFPGKQGMASVLGSIPPELVLVTGTSELAAPVVWCGGEPPDELHPLVIACYRGDDEPICHEGIIDRTFSMLPQMTGEECGKCGLDCMGLAKSIIGGSRDPDDCFYSPDKVIVEQDGTPMEIGKFPADILKNTIRGLLSSLKGYREGSNLTIRLD